MKKIALIALTAASALAIAAPAMAQSYGYRDYGRYDSRWDRNAQFDINHRQDQLARRIENGIRAGSVSHWEARNLRGELNEIARIEARYRYNGFQRWELADLDRRMDRLELQIRHDRTDADRRDREYGYYDYRR